MENLSVTRALAELKVLTKRIESIVKGLVLGDTTESEVPCGEDAGMINSILGAKEVVDNMIKGIPAIMKDLETRLSY